jgi:hypothetical protein
MKTYFINAAIAFDVFVNVLLGGLEGETLSARSGRAKDAGKLWGRLLAGVLNAIFPGHTKGAQLHDAQRAETVETVEELNLKNMVK